MKQNKSLLYLSFLLGVAGLFLVTACNKDDDTIDISCTYVQDPTCFCQENPNNPLCNLSCTFETNPMCFCEANPEDEQCCTFEFNSECYCEANPTDILCTMSGGMSSGVYTFFDFEDQPAIDSIFNTGYTPDNPEGGFQDNARAIASLGSGDAAQGEFYFINEIEVINAGWTWTSNLFKTVELDLSSLSEPTLNFWVRTSNSKPALMEIAMVDDSGESGYHPGGPYMEVNGNWKQFSLNLNNINATEDWKWGDGINVGSINFLKFGFNAEGQEMGDIYEVHIDDVYIDDGVPFGAVEYPMVMDAGEFHTYFDFENQPEIDSIFNTGYTPDNPEGGFQNNARATASLGNGDAAQGDYYFINEIEVFTAGWTWTSDLFDNMMIDASALSSPCLNFWARTSNAKPALFEIALTDDSGESGWHPGGVYSEVNGDWQLFSINIEEINNLNDWKWGDGIDPSMLRGMKFGFNAESQEMGDIFEVHIDQIYLSDGAPSGAIAYPAAPAPDYERFYTYFDFENTGADLTSFYETGYIPDNPNGFQENVRAIASFGTGDAAEGDGYFINELEVLTAGWTWSSNLFSDVALDVSGLDNPTINFWARTSNAKPALLEFALVDDTGECGWHPGGVYTEINGDWQQFSIQLGVVNATEDWKWGDGWNFEALSFLKFGFNAESQEMGDIFEIHVDDIHLANGSPEGAVVYPQ